MSNERENLFVALYAGDTIGNARIVAASADPDLVRTAADCMLRESATQTGSSSATAALDAGKRAALRLARGEGAHDE